MSLLIGDLMDYDTVYNFGKQVDVLTFEIENVNVRCPRSFRKRRYKSISIVKNFTNHSK